MGIVGPRHILCRDARARRRTSCEGTGQDRASPSSRAVTYTADATIVTHVRNVQTTRRYTASQNLVLDAFFSSRGRRRITNGGYAAGVAARLLAEPAQVSLVKPPVVGRPLTARFSESGVDIFDRDELVLAAKPRGQLAVKLPHIDLAAARATVTSPHALARHAAPTCVVCGPERADGFRIFPGSLRPGVVATSWHVPTIGCDEGQEMSWPVVWAALDCPGGWCFEGGHVKFAPALVSQSVDILQPIHAGDEVIVVGWETGRTGRMLGACTALLDLRGRPLAVSEQVCVALSRTWAK